MVKRRGIVWSVDVIIGLVIFIGAIVLFFALTTGPGREDARQKLVTENRAIVNALENSPELAMVNFGELDAAKVQKLADMDYDELKAKLGLTNDFCIVFQDAAGNIVEIGGVRSLGDPRIKYEYEGQQYPCGKGAVTPPPPPATPPPPPPPPPPVGALFACTAKSSACSLGETCAYQFSSTGHARDCTASDPLYPQRMCCGSGLSGCTLACTSQSTSCGAGYAEMIELSAAVNAHLQDPALTPDYPQHICCTAVGAGCGGKAFQQCTVAAICGSNEICAGSVTGPTNADVAACGVYSSSICCKV